MYRFVLALPVLVFATSAAWADELTVNFMFDSASKCSKTSPEIRISGIPEGTIAFKIRLKDKNAPNWRHGGGTVSNDGSGIIPKGALKDGYNGPCPPSGSHTYVFTVRAMDANDDELAEGEKSQRFP